MKVQKRPKMFNNQMTIRTVEFDPGKITSAIYRAAMAVGGKDFKRSAYLTEKVLEKIAEDYPERDIITVEEIQDMVEWVLVHNGHYKTAKAYILYRQQHEKIRTADVVKNSDNIKNYLGYDNLAVNENANMTFSVQGLKLFVSETVTSQYWLNEIYPESITNAFTRGDMHIHDLGMLAPYCVGWDLQTLLREGFNGVKGKISAKPPKHFRSAMGQIYNFLFTLQGEAAGAQAFSNFDTLLAPFISYDNLDYHQVKQVMQEFVFNMNVPTRVGFQTPFTNITLDLKVPEFMKDEPVIIGGKYMDAAYGEFQAEMDIFNQAFAEIMLEGDAEGRVFSFPIPTYNITEDFDWDNPVYEAIWEMTAKYGIPNWCNYIGSEMNPEDARSMCCRLRLDNRELQKRMGGLFSSAPLTGSLGVVTINLPRIGYLAENREDFFLRLGMAMDIAKDSLEIKRKTIENFTELSENVTLYPYSRRYLRDIKTSTGQYWTNHFSTIGLVGMNETCLNFLGSDIGSPEGHAFALEVMDYMLQRITCYQDKTGNLYNLESTPAEGAAYKLALKDKSMFPDIVTSGNDEPYYTNSTQLPANYTSDLFRALHLQEPLQVKYTGGTTFHAFLGEKLPDPQSVKKLIKKISYGFKIPYFTITPTFSICSEHGYYSGEVWECPQCGRENEVYSRIVGYIRPVQQWNLGQQEQYKNRSIYDPEGQNLLLLS